ncbi:hypothetical protein FEM48_Zijuj04G0180300 [Ziziphus jujuba var. spinosa]|uniref:ATP-dependent DNA ligase family profile domain-containing protein n=1 Tax=Ziziphus jujuba var. spinosa TaxID=714518 RepID=A0A978VLC8_ZIZJJ|nr:hypothetical protein FEM48_Zijuj04G0180300 [Ziziphus jujuba var. spinosa]
MAGARAATKMKMQSSDPKKRKAVDSNPPPKPDSPPNSVGSREAAPAAPAAKKACFRWALRSSGSVEEEEEERRGVSELKSKITELKKKAWDFKPESVASCWKHRQSESERVPFLFLSLAFDLIANETRRIVITDIVCNMLRTVMHTTTTTTTHEDLLAVVYRSANRIAPAYQGLELGIGDASIINALSEAYGSGKSEVKRQYKDLGDLGLVAKARRSSHNMVRRRPNPLTVANVLKTFRLIAKDSGKDSQMKKKNHIKALLLAATDCEPQYLIRLLQAVKIVKQVYSVLPDYGVWDLQKTCNFTVVIPVGPMQANPTKGVSKIVQKFQDTEYTCEYKYDGERAQIHYLEDGSVAPVKIYSRNAERNTGKFPDVVAAVSRLKQSSVRSFVLDCELVAYDREKQKILPFQVLSTQARKNVVMSEIKCLYGSFEEEAGYFQFATAITSNDINQIQKFFDASVDGSCEGLIIKTLNKDATYEPSKRSLNWLKLKKDYMDGIGDSLDLVPIAAFHCRENVQVSMVPFFWLVMTTVTKFQSICKIGTGFSEAMLEERSASLRSEVIPQPKVWEVKAADLTISPVHRAAVGIVDLDKVADIYTAQSRNHKIKMQGQSSDSGRSYFSVEHLEVYGFHCMDRLRIFSPTSANFPKQCWAVIAFVHGLVHLFEGTLDLIAVTCNIESTPEMVQTGVGLDLKDQSSSHFWFFIH